jgi:hypothetical protein
MYLERQLRVEGRAAVSARGYNRAEGAYIRFCETNPIFFEVIFGVSLLFAETYDVCRRFCKWVRFGKTNPILGGIWGVLASVWLPFGFVFGLDRGTTGSGSLALQFGDKTARCVTTPYHFGASQKRRSNGRGGIPDRFLPHWHLASNVVLSRLR